MLIDAVHHLIHMIFKMAELVLPGGGEVHIHILPSDAPDLFT